MTKGILILNILEKFLAIKIKVCRISPVAQIAQSVEQGIENPRVGGSIPPLGTSSFKRLIAFFLSLKNLNSSSVIPFCFNNLIVVFYFLPCTKFLFSKFWFLIYHPSVFVSE